MINTKISNESSLAMQLPYWEFFDDPIGHVVLNDGSIVAGIMVGLIDIECFDERKINQLTSGLRSLLDSISEGVTVQFLMSIKSDYAEFLNNSLHQGQEDIHPLIQKIAMGRKKNLTEEIDYGELYRPELYIFFKATPINRKTMSFFKKKDEFSKESFQSYEEVLELLIQNLENLKSNFDSLGIHSEVLSQKEITAKIYHFLNPKRSLSEPLPEIKTLNENFFEQDEVSQEAWLADTSPREQLCFGDLVLGLENYSLDSNYHKVITLKTLPEMTFAGQISNFLRMPFHYDLFLTFEVPMQATEFSKLQQKRKMAHSLTITQGNQASDLESESKLSSTEELIRELLNTGQRIYAVQMSIILRASANAEGEKILNRQVRDVLSRFRSLQGAEGLEETVGAWKIVRGNLPAAPLELVRAKKMKTHNLADFLPIYGPRIGDDDPVVIFKNRLNGLVGFNSFDPTLPNYNSLVTGSSGAGKSFLNNCILLQELNRGLKVFIIDIGGSYKKITEALDGKYIEMNLTDQYKINPFHIHNILEGLSNQKLKSLLAIIESMVGENEKTKLLKLDRAILEKSIIELYKFHAKKGEIPTLTDLSLLLSSSDEDSMRTISKMLYLWTGDRPYGKLLDGQGSLNSEARICTFDLKGLSSYPDLQSVMILILTDFILTQIEMDKSQRKRIILDEAWELLKSDAAANFMEYCARTLRKTGSGITFITQGIEEIAASPIGSAILNNTATKFIMLQRGDSEILKNTLKLNSQELNLIHSLEQKKGKYSEGFMIEGDHRQVVRIFPNPIEYWLATSDATDNNYLNQLQVSGMSLLEAIELAAHDYPQGFSQKKGGKS